MPSGSFPPIGAELFDDDVGLFGKLPGVDQEAAFLVEGRLLSLEPERDRPSGFFFRAHANLERGDGRAAPRAQREGAPFTRSFLI